MTCWSSVRQAACVYSLISPPRTGFGGSAVCLCRSRWREERQVRRRGRAGRCPGAAGPGCGAPGWYSARTARRCRSPRISIRSRSSRRRVPTRRSQIAFIPGAWTAVRRILAPAAWNTASKTQVKFDPRSRTRNLMSAHLSSRPRTRLRACCTVHSPAGFAVTPPRCIRRVPCSMNTGHRISCAARCPRAGSRPRGSRQPGRAGTAARSGPSDAALDRCPQHAGSPRQWTGRPSRRACSVRRGCGGVPTRGNVELNISSLVPLENRTRVVTSGSSGYQAARAYSLIRPPRTGFRRIRPRSRSPTVRWPSSCSPLGTRWAMPLCGRAVL